ncbi:MAG: pyrroloquinoline quinone-dependent dehydrogenase [Proteobacteria bacterium]|nr:pyrroloquinoline quinone-dependent dehydrogenase [Pseudomonadota bacterium]
MAWSADGFPGLRGLSLRGLSGWGLSTAGLALLLAEAAVLGCGPPREPCPPAPTGGASTEWPSYGNDPGGTRYSPLADIDGANVRCLEEAWTYHTGDLPDSRGEHASSLASEVTPVLVDDTLYLCTPYNRVIALDPETGRERWSFDPKLPLDGHYANQLVCRGVSPWLDPAAEADDLCRRRIFTATNDARLIALDAPTGQPCLGFGADGQVDLNPGVGEQEWRGEYQVTSPPAVGADVVIVGSAVADNRRDDAPSGVVRGFDARTGALRWAWDLRPPDFVATAANTTEAGYALATPNVWAPMAVDPERDLVFVPTGNPAPDYFRGESNLDHYGSSVVALRATTGEVVWNFQTVHRDLWDFDVPAQPTLFQLRRDGEEIPALVQATKMGLLFVLHRETGEPLFPVVERPVPQIEVPGEYLSPTQPFPTKPPPLVPHSLSPDDAYGLTPWGRGACREALAALRFEGIYTPPTEQGTLMVPGNAGGSNWGGVAVDEANQRLVANVHDLPWSVTLIPREEAEAEGFERDEFAEYAPMRGAPYVMRRVPVLSPVGIPCNPPPWGMLAAVDLETGSISWQVTLGTSRDISPLPIALETGTPTLGGPLVTGGGLIFIGAAFEKVLRAFDVENGREVWSARLPYGPQATPMTYRAGGRQFVVIAATGYERGGMPPGDAIVAFALPTE